MFRMEEEVFSFSFWVILSTGLHFLAFFGVVLHALQRRRNPGATVLWIFLALSFPVVGALFYLAFGVDRVADKGFEKRVSNEALHRAREGHHSESSGFMLWHKKYRVNLSSLDPLLERLNKALDFLIPEHPLLEGNQIQPLLCGDEAYPLMMDAIRSATHHIHIQSFIFAHDETTIEFLDLLKQKAEEGIKVRLLFDRFGSAHAYLSGLFRKYAKTPNLDIQGWTQANVFKRQFQINLRNHRKNLVVDGRIAFFGGVNISSENKTIDKKPPIRDYHFQVQGPLVHELQYAFLRDWHFITGESIDCLLISKHFPSLKTEGNVYARIIDSGPSYLPGLLGETFFNAIVMAQKQILLVTPYFAPTIDLIKALRSAARRGVDVRIILPEENNHRYAGFAAKALYEELLEAGVRIFHRKPPFIHAKAMLIDNTTAFVGTSNFDVRSLELNYETTVLICEEVAINKIKENILEDISLSTEIFLNAWLKRPASQKLLENLCSLMTPIL
jgi:cardiolipin synthase